MITWLLRRMEKKARIAAYLAALPSNGRRDDEIGELVHTAYNGERHIHQNPPKGVKKNKREVQNETVAEG